MTIEEIKKKSPILINRDRWNRIKTQTNKLLEGNKVQLHAIHLYYKTLNAIEYSLMNDEAKDCCYLLNDKLREFDGYLVFVGDIDGIPDYWKEKLDSGLGDTIEVPEKIFDDDYFERYTRQLKKLDIIYVVNHYKMKGISNCIGIPIVSTIGEIIEDIFGTSDKDVILFEKEKIEDLYNDPLWTIPSFTCSEIKICLQDIVKHDCKMHNKEEYHFEYKVHGLTIHSILSVISDTICTVRFFTDYIEDKDHYMYLNHKLDDRIVKKIYDNSEYWTTKIEEDFI